MTLSKEEYSEQVEDWEALFNKHDPCGHILCGAPPDEYWGEIERTSRRYKDCLSLSELEALVWKAFSTNGPLPDKTNCNELAAELWLLASTDSIKPLSIYRYAELQDVPDPEL